MTIPADVAAGNSLYKTVVSELTPILCDPLRFGISVVTPEITTVSEVVRL